ncbi:MAG: nitroreductase [Geothermobacteraceae bacterium]
MNESDWPPAPPADLSPEQIRAAVDWAIRSRRSVRAFRPDTVPRAVIEEILDVAARAPSVVNTQPWQVWVVTGATRRRLADAIMAAFDDPDRETKYRAEYSYYPKSWTEPYLSRRRKIGWDLYGLLGIGKRDKEKMHAQHRRNFDFFDAPVGLFLTMDRILAQGSWLDCGMFLQNFMTAARGRGLDSCPQAAFIHFHSVIREFLGIPDEQILLCGLSLGYADDEATENRLVTQREPVEGFARFFD